MPDLNKLKGIMVENGKTYVDGARVIGCSVTSFSAKMNGKSNFTVLEANELSNALNLSKEDRATIFLVQILRVMQDLRKKGEGIPSDNPSQKGGYQWTTK